MQSIKVNILENLENQIKQCKNQKFKLNEFGYFNGLNDSSILKMSEQSFANKRDLEIEIEKLKKIRREEAFLYYSGMTNEKPSTLSH